MPYLETLFDQLPAFAELRKQLAAADRTDGDKNAPALVINGLSEIHKAHMCAALRSSAKRMCLFIAADSQEAGRLCGDLTAMGLRAGIYPVRDLSFYAIEGQSREFEHSRIEALCGMLDGSLDAVITTADAVMQLTVPPEQLSESTAEIKTGSQLSKERLVSALSAGGYERSDTVEGSGQYAVRGGIVDFFPPASEYPIRVELFGDEIDTVYTFEPESQRRLDPVGTAHIYPAEELAFPDASVLGEKITEIASRLRSPAQAKAKARLQQEADAISGGLRPASLDKYIPIICRREATVLDYLPENGYIAVSEHISALETAQSYEKRLREEIKSLIEDGILCPSLDRFTLSSEELWGRFGGHTVFLDSFSHGNYGYNITVKPLPHIEANTLPAWDGSISVLKEDLDGLLSLGRAVAVLAGTEKAADNLCGDLADEGIEAIRTDEPDMLVPGKVAVLPGKISCGFEYPTINAAVITCGGTLGARRPQKHKPRYKPGAEIQSLSELSEGDYVVHIQKGIAVFRGVAQLEDSDFRLRDYIKLEFARGDISYVPVVQLDLVSKYIGSREDGAVKLTTLGTGEWQRQKTRVRKAVRDIAKELIKIYAKRMQTKGYAFDPDTEYQRDFEARFEYSETEDQLRCVDEIKNDMEKAVPMERLLCGDVGFGKTEVAFRAAFKCMVEGRQAVLMAPTTILAWQHYQTALQRFDGFPFRIELLSRFRTPKQQAAAIEGIRKGTVDFVIGTHRVISKDVVFRDLGLSIIDEEQRFGVAHKEKFKSAFAGIDQILLSATPIPRTLNMALSGLRDISVLNEPPTNRLPVQTYVMAYDRDIVGDAIKRELRRGGQVYYLHNKVADIDITAGKLQELVPEARIGVAHGQMSEHQISREWKRLIDHEIDILVCTTIIEAGVDVANANTLIVEHADRFGLSQLHQIRGRVGRSSRRAYAYFTFDGRREMTEIARKRLSAIRQFTEFGSGMKIATRDLELRGAGNLLGAEQSGQLDTVGYDLYMKLLSEAVAIEKGEKQVEDLENGCTVDIPIEAHIPNEYIDSTRLRLDVYRSIADIRSEQDASDVTDELVDRFGDVPESVYGLIRVALLRSKAAALGITEIKYGSGNILFYFAPSAFDKIAGMLPRLDFRVLLSAGVKPYLTVKPGKSDDLISDIQETIDAFCAAQAPRSGEPG